MSWAKRVGRAAAMVALLILALLGADELGRYADDTNPYGGDEDKE